MAFDHIPSEDGVGRAVWVQTLAIERKLWLLGAVATAIARDLGMTEADVYERARSEALSDPMLQKPPT